MSKDKNPEPMTSDRLRNQPGHAGGTGDRSTASGARTAEEAQADRDSAENKRDTSGDQKVGVVALRTFARDGNPTSEDVVRPGDEFECDRGRAAELRANGLIKYADDKQDEEIHGKVDAERIQHSIAQTDKLREIPKTAKGTPLRNPEVKLADVDDKDGK